MKPVHIRTLFVPFILSLLVITAACNVFGASFKGNQVTPSTTAPEIKVIDDHGNDFKLSGLQGKVVLILFGFTNCVDECPLAMAKLKLAMENLGEKSQDVKVVMVSTDPVRDTPQAMQNFLSKFNPDFLGLPGNSEQLSRIWSEYDVEVLDGGETHSSYIYAIDKSGKLRLTLDIDLTPEDIASDLKILIAEK